MREWSELALRVKVMREGVAVACGALAIVLGLAAGAQAKTIDMTFPDGQQSLTLPLTGFGFGNGSGKVNVGQFHVHSKPPPTDIEAALSQDLADQTDLDQVIVELTRTDTEITYTFTHVTLDSLKTGPKSFSVVFDFRKVSIDYSHTSSDVGDTASLGAFNGDNPVVAGKLYDSPLSASVPEPSSWAMILIGFASLGLTGWGFARKSPLATLD
jgi:hypothetical protein